MTLPSSSFFISFFSRRYVSSISSMWASTHVSILGRNSTLKLLKRSSLGSASCSGSCVACFNSISIDRYLNGGNDRIEGEARSASAISNRAAGAKLLIASVRPVRRFFSLMTGRPVVAVEDATKLLGLHDVVAFIDQKCELFAVRPSYGFPIAH